MKKQIINLRGFLSAEQGSELYLHCKEFLDSQTRLVLDARELVLIDNIGWEYLKKLKKLADERGARISACSLLPAWMGEWESIWGNSCPVYKDREEAISAVETPSKKELEIQHRCPHCGSIQVSQETGLRKCTVCGGNFMLYRNGIAIAYERLI